MKSYPKLSISVQLVPAGGRRIPAFFFKYNLGKNRVGSLRVRPRIQSSIECHLDHKVTQKRRIHPEMQALEVHLVNNVGASTEVLHYRSTLGTSSSQNLLALFIRRKGRNTQSVAAAFWLSVRGRTDVLPTFVPRVM